MKNHKQLCSLTCLIFVVSVLVLTIIFNFQFFKTSIKNTFAKDQENIVTINFNDSLNFSYDVTKIKIDENGARVADYNTHADIVLLDVFSFEKETQLIGFKDYSNVTGKAEIHYQLSSDLKNWYYFNGREWTLADKCRCSNTATQINENISTFPFETKTLTVKILMSSDRINIPSLNKIEIGIKGQTKDTINALIINERFRNLFLSMAQADDECGECDGKVTTLTLKYTGDQSAQIRVEQKKEGTIYDQTLSAGDEFTINGQDKKGTLGTEISLYIDDELNTEIHTSCSEPIGPGLISGDFLVIYGESRNGGELCPLEPVCGNGLLEEGEECDDGNLDNGDGCSSVCIIEEESDPYFNLAVCYLCDLGTQPTQARFGYLARDLNPGNLERNTVTNGGDLPTFDGVNVAENTERVWSTNIYEMNTKNYVWTVKIDGKQKTSTIDKLNGHEPTFYDTMRCPQQEPECGNGILEEGEECDDGNLNNGDGCTALCLIEEPTPEMQSVRPILECVKQNQFDYTAYFGYLNENEEEVTIPIGDENRFNPSPWDRGQPEVFSPGRTSYYPNAAFSVNFDGNNLVWIIKGPDGETRTATASDNPEVRCPSDPQGCETVNFTQPLTNVDGNLASWSLGDSVVNLASSSWSILSGSGTIYGYVDSQEAGLTHRGTRGIGVNGQEIDEVDSHLLPEKVEVVFDEPVCVDELEVRSLFTNDAGWQGTEEGDIDLFLNDTLVQNYHLLGYEDITLGNTGIWSTNVPNIRLNKISYYVQEDQDYSANSDFAISRIKICPCLCGNGALDEGEQCDDGNYTNGDGCSSDCTVEIPACDPNIELVNNGSFEQPIVNNSLNWDSYPEGTENLSWDIAWYSATTQYQGYDRPQTALLEIQRYVNGWQPAEGDQYAELDTDWDGPGGALNGEPASVTISQDIPTIPGQVYQIKFSFAARPGTTSGNNVLEFKWDGQIKDTLSAPGNSQPEWTEHIYNFVASGTSTKIEFTDLGVLDSYGTFIDNVSVRCVGQENVCIPDALLRIDYSRIQNYEDGNSTANTFVGPNAEQYSNGAIIPLTDGNGNFLIDNGLDFTVPGLSVERGLGFLHFILEGSQQAQDLEIVDAMVRFKNGIVTGFENDTTYPLENQGDGIFQDLATQDEVFPNIGNYFFEVYSRVNTHNDGFYIEYECTQTDIICGNGFLEGNEECDDGNNEDMDGCSAQCIIEDLEPPIAVDDNLTIPPDDQVDIDVLVNDYDNDGTIDPTTVFITIAPNHGNIVDVDPVTGEVTYDPDDGYIGIDTFEYQVCDNDGLCDTAIVTVSIEEPLYPPVANDDNAQVIMNNTVDIDILNNDTDSDGTIDPSTVTIITNPSNGTINSIDPTTGLVNYEPDLDFYGIDTFEYQVCDNDGLCDTAIVEVLVKSPPIANDDSASAENEIPVDIDILDNDTDPDGSLMPNTVSITSDPSNGTITNTNATTGVITYQANPSFEGLDEFEYEVCDNDGLCDTAIVQIAVEVLAPPIANDDSAGTRMSESVIIDILANDSDSDGTLDPTSVTITADPSNGTITDINTLNGAVTYLPNDGFRGGDSFEYQVCDNDSLCDTAIVNISVTGGGGRITKPPVANDDAETTELNTPVNVDIMDNDYDPDGTLNFGSITIIGNPTNGTIININLDTGEVTYEPNQGFTGTDTFNYRVCDYDSLCDNAQVSVSVASLAPPIANDDSASTPANTPIIIDILDNDSDPDGILLPETINIILLPINGQITNINLTTGELTYFPDTDYTGSDDLEYEICDNDGLCDSAQVIIEVLGGNLPPIANDDSASTTINTPVIIDILANDNDPDGIIVPSTVSLISAPANGAVIGDATTGEITYTPETDFSGDDSFVYEVCDNDGLCDTATVFIIVTETPTPPPPLPPTPPLVVPPAEIPAETLVTVTTSVGINEAICGQTYYTPNILLVGTINVTPGSSAKLEYSMNDGGSWRNINKISGLETGSGTFNIRLTNLLAGDYEVLIRATTDTGVILSSVPCPFTIGTSLIFASNQFVVNNQPSPMSPLGIVQFNTNEPQTFYLEAKGASDASVYKLNAETREREDEFQLIYNEDIKLWVGELVFDEPGFYPLEAEISNSSNIYSREINSIIVAQKSRIIDAKTNEPIAMPIINVFEKDPASKKFNLWDAVAYGQSNPFLGFDDGTFSIILPEGEFYLEIEAPGYNSAKSVITQIKDNSMVTASVSLEPKAGLINDLLSTGSGASANLQLEIQSVPETSLLTVGQELSDILLQNDEGLLFSLFNQITDEPLIVFLYSTWNTLSQEQIQIYTNITENFADEYPFYPISTIEPFNLTVKHNVRGEYDIQNLKPTDDFYDKYEVITTPQIFVINPDRTLRGLIVGPYQETVLMENLEKILAE